jgi:hypothetical protein
VTHAAGQAPESRASHRTAAKTAATAWRRPRRATLERTSPEWRRGVGGWWPRLGRADGASLGPSLRWGGLWRGTTRPAGAGGLWWGTTRPATLGWAVEEYVAPGCAGVGCGGVRRARLRWGGLWKGTTRPAGAGVGCGGVRPACHPSKVHPGEGRGPAPKDQDPSVAPLRIGPAHPPTQPCRSSPSTHPQPAAPSERRAGLGVRRQPKRVEGPDHGALAPGFRRGGPWRMSPRTRGD